MGGSPVRRHVRRTGTTAKIKPPKAAFFFLPRDEKRGCISGVEMLFYSSLTTQYRNQDSLRNDALEEQIPSRSE
jgi:hypothetical protein